MGRRPKYYETSGGVVTDTDPEKARILQHLAEGRLVPTRHHRVGFSGISGVWARFSLLVKPYSDETVGFVQCNCCRSVLRYDSHRTGTSSLKRHRCARSLEPATCKDSDCCWLCLEDCWGDWGSWYGAWCGLAQGWPTCGPGGKCVPSSPEYFQ